MTTTRLALVCILVAGCSSEHGSMPAADARPGDPPPPPADDAGAGPTIAPFAIDTPGIYEMATDATHLYWVDNGQADHEANVRRMPLDGGPIETLYSMPERVYSLAVADGFVYFVHTPGGLGDYAGHVYRVPVTGGAATELAAAFNPTSVSVDGDWVYFSEAVSPDGRVLRVPTTGGAAEIVVASADNPWDLVADRGVLFYSEMNAGRMMRVVPGQSPVELAGGWVATNWMTVDAANVYFTACDSGDCSMPKMFQVPRDGGTAQQVIVGLSGGAKLDARGTNVQWGTEVVSTSGGGVRAFDGANDPVAVATTDKAVYYGDFFTGAIFRFDL